jgi:hypothetical protein
MVEQDHAGVVLLNLRLIGGQAGAVSKESHTQSGADLLGAEARVSPDRGAQLYDCLG